jgi:hypothetical protein
MSDLSLVEYYGLTNSQSWAKFIDDLLEVNRKNFEYFRAVRKEEWLYELLWELLQDRSIYSAINIISANRHRLQVVIYNSSGEKQQSCGDRLAAETNTIIATIVQYYLETNGIHLFLARSK